MVQPTARVYAQSRSRSVCTYIPVLSALRVARFICVSTGSA